jgi:integrase
VKAKISKRTVDALAPGEAISDTEIRGFVARRLRSGTLTYGYRYRHGPNRKWLPLGLHGRITAEQARELAKKRAGEVADNRDPAKERAAARAVSANSVNAVLDSFISRHARARDRALRSADAIERTFERLVRPRLGTKSIYEVQRRDVVEMLDSIEDASGPVMADRTLAYLRKAFNWWATRDDRFNPPIVKGMARTKPKERARKRILDDQEIRDVWRALDELGDEAPICFPSFVRALLLTAQRRDNVATMRREEVTDAGWVIPGNKFKTGEDHLVPLTEASKELIGPTRRRGFVFSSDGGKRAFSGYSKAKRALDQKIAEIRRRERRPAMPHWVYHDLRRTARSLMSRAGVPSDHAERALGHVIPGVRGVYDRYAYVEEKKEALQMLAALVQRILRPGDSVVPFPKSPGSASRA